MPSGRAAGVSVVAVGEVVAGDAGVLVDAAVAAGDAGDADGAGAGDDNGLLTAAGAGAAACDTGSSATFENSLCHDADQLRREGAFTLILSQRTVRICDRNRHQATLQKHVHRSAIRRPRD